MANLLSLPDALLYDIGSRLELWDACSLSATNRRLHAVLSKQIYHRIPTEYLYWLVDTVKVIDFKRVLERGFDLNARDRAGRFREWPLLAYILALQDNPTPARLIMATALFQAGVVDTKKWRIGDVDRSDMTVQLLERYGVQVVTSAQDLRIRPCTQRWVTRWGWLEWMG
jgi:hypothetical protein